jgi:hypothetical protein
MMNLLLLSALWIGTGSQPLSATANLRFSGPENLTVQCVAGCPVTEKIYLPDRFPSLSVVDGAERRVRLRFRATGYRSKTTEVQVRAGDNQIRVHLDPVVAAS